MVRRTKPSLSEDALTALGTGRLARLLLDQARDDPNLHRKLEALIADAGRPPVEPACRVIGSIERRIGTLANMDGYDDWRSAAALGTDIDAIRHDIIDDLLPGTPRAAADLLTQLIELQHSLFDMADDSDGELGDALRQVVDDWGRAWALIGGGVPEEVADIVFDAVADNPYGVLDEVILAFEEALGERGVAALEARFRAALGDLSERPPADNDREADWARRRSYRGLQEIADIKGDVDAFIAAHEAAGTHLVYTVEIAERLHRAGRAAEALHWLERPDGRTHPNNDPTDLHVAVLSDLGRQDDARAVRWRAFDNTLSVDHFGAYLEMTPETDHTCIHDKAVTIARNHSDVHRALALLTGIGALAEAEALVLRRRGELNDRAYWLLRPAAEALAPGHPLAAAVLYRILAEGALRTGKTKYYPYGIEDLRQATLLAEGISEWNGMEDHETFMERLRTQHGRKRTFWAQW